MFALSPCKGCATGWAYEPPPIANATGLGTPVGYGWTTGSPGTVSLNFTGTGISFQLHGTSTPESTVLSINGTEYAGLEAQDIPWGLHSVHLIVDPGPNVMNTTQTARRVTVAGATIALGTMSSATTRNVTVDDTDWRSGKVVLSSGWNMLEKDQSNWINSVSGHLSVISTLAQLQTQMEMEQPNAGKYWNQSVSWTEQQGANTTVLFSGSAVRAYGISGAQAGQVLAPTHRAEPPLTAHADNTGHTPSGWITPLSAATTRRQDLGRMARYCTRRLDSPRRTIP